VDVAAAHPAVDHDVVPTAPRPSIPAPVLELRRYTLHPGRRDTLIELFERELLGPQEDCGMRMIGQFHDLDDPDQFVWLRGFPDMESRRRALSRFYDGPVWARHRDAANATMIDHTNVLLLRPSAPDRGLPPAPAAPGSDDAPPDEPALLCAAIHPVAEEPSSDLLARVDDVVGPVLDAAGGTTVAELQTAQYENSFPRLPVREGEHVIVRLARFPGGEHGRRPVPPAAWRSIQDGLGELLVGPVEQLWLRPTARSALT
jgi:hypothetical protein